VNGIKGKRSGSFFLRCHVGSGEVGQDGMPAARWHSHCSLDWWAMVGGLLELGVESAVLRENRLSSDMLWSDLHDCQELLCLFVVYHHRNIDSLILVQ
jgi:hypothetical protein